MVCAARTDLRSRKHEVVVDCAPSDPVARLDLEEIAADESRVVGDEIPPEMVVRRGLALAILLRLLGGLVRLGVEDVGVRGGRLFGVHYGWEDR